MPRLGLGFLSSHGGSAMRAIVTAARDGILEADARLLVSNNSGSEVMEFARRNGIPTCHLSSKTHPDPDELDEAMFQALDLHSVEVIVMSGFMKKVGPRVLKRYRRRVLNVHPALLPKYGGQGMYGLAVHEAVLASGDAVTGVTIHLADDEYDRGPVLAQRKVEIEPGETTETLQNRLKLVEAGLFVELLQKVASGEVELDSYQ